VEIAYPKNKKGAGNYDKEPAIRSEFDSKSHAERIAPSDKQVKGIVMQIQQFILRLTS
jgi:hypothetical protein